MEDNGITYDSARFSSVWARVTGAQPPAAGPGACDAGSEAERLRGFIDAEAAAALCFDWLARRCACESGLFRRLGCGARRRVKKLQTAYFVLTGESCAARPARAPAGTPSEALRLRCSRESDDAAAYARAAGEAQGAAAAMYRAFSCQRERAARLLSGAIERRLI